MIVQTPIGTGHERFACIARRWHESGLALPKVVVDLTFLPTHRRQSIIDVPLADSGPPGETHSNESSFSVGIIPNLKELVVYAPLQKDCERAFRCPDEFSMAVMGTWASGSLDEKWTCATVDLAMGELLR